MKKTLISFLFIFVYAASFASGFPSISISSEMVYSQSFELNTQITSDSNKDTDKKALIEQTKKEVFTDFANKIDSLKKYIRLKSLMIYVDDYLKEETAKIELKIANKTYVQRFASTEKEWVDTDFAEVAAKLKVRTLDRIKDIMIDVQESTPGLYTMTADKLRLLEKKVREEIGVDTP